MAKFKRRPVLVEAEQFVVWDLKNIPLSFTAHGITFPVYKDDNGNPYIVIPTLQGLQTVLNLDWIVKDPYSGLCPCKADVFEKHYEPVQS